jgi:hypothetical protein
MAKSGDTLPISLPTEKAIAGLLAVKPTVDMPRPGTQPSKVRKRVKRPPKPRG